MTQTHWVFGYGSLIFKQDFPFIESRPAHINGWSRRFWQGSHDHRGTEQDPGRVVTLIEAPGEICHGRAFLIDHDVFEHLDHREKNGYSRLDTTIHFANGSVQGVTYHAPVGNFAFLGDAPLEAIAQQIQRCHGPSGSNRDYALELARALREHGIHDTHVFSIETLIS
ncbi:MAG: gamma-glutamylcyclotransferase [Pseudomonadota bacterium]